MSDSMCYLATDANGCDLVAIVDNPEHARDVAKEIAACIRDGLSVARITVDQFRTSTKPFGHVADCPFGPKPRVRKSAKRQAVLL